MFFREDYIIFYVRKRGRNRIEFYTIEIAILVDLITFNNKITD